MKRLMLCAFVAFATLLFGGAEAQNGMPGEKILSKSECKKVNGKCVKPPKQAKSKQKKKQKPLARTEEKAPTTLSGRQEQMRKAFLECVGHSTGSDPVGALKAFVFEEQHRREGFTWRAFMEALRGSPEHHGHEVCLSRAHGLKTFRTLGEITGAPPGIFVPLQAVYLEVDEREIPTERRVIRPWVLEYLSHLAADMHEKFNQGPLLRVTSGIRPVDEQQKLVKKGWSPADCTYDYLCSTHTTGGAVDLGLRGLGEHEIKWLQDRLVKDQDAQKIFFIRENSHFHVFVLPSEYVGEE